MERKIIVVTAAFGADIVNQAGGQQSFIPLIAQAGADGVEIRRELFSSSVNDALPPLRELAEKHRLITYYSVPEALFVEPGIVNPRLEAFQQEAELLNAQAIKFALGAGAGTCTREMLAKRFAHCKVPLLIENDQTSQGQLHPMETYFSHYHGLPNVQGMTFDMANWRWVNESPLEAAQQLAPYVAYCHVKAAKQTASSWQAVSLDHSDNEWRHLLKMMPRGIPLGIEFPLDADDLTKITAYYVNLLRTA